MSLLTVDHIVLRAGVRYGVITVSLYKGGAAVGDCGTYPGDKSRQTLSCDKVLADMVKLTRIRTSPDILILRVIEIAVYQGEYRM